jgi:hypothetical protein
MIAAKMACHIDFDNPDFGYLDMGFDLSWHYRDVTLRYIYVQTNALCHDRSLIVDINNVNHIIK